MMRFHTPHFTSERAKEKNQTLDTMLLSMLWYYINIDMHEEGYMFLHRDSERERLDLVGAPCNERGKGREMERG
jgi:hypothetical protein